MAVSPEREKPPVPEGVEKRLEEVPEVSPDLEKAGVQVRQTQVTAQVTDDQGRQLIQAPATQVVTIQIPAPQAQLADWSHGSPASSLTWLATFWLRMIKKALHFGWRIVTKGGVS
jgi:hypothetical protein